MNLANLTTFSCGTRGISVGNGISPVSELMMNNCALLQCCQGNSSDNVLTLTYCIDPYVNNCTLNQNGGANALRAVALSKVFNGEFNNVTANENVAGAGYKGFRLDGISYCRFNSCKTKNCIVTGGTANARGFSLEFMTSATGNYFYDCAALNISGQGAVDGFISATGCNNNHFERCQSSYNTSYGATAAAIVTGFNITNTATQIIDCIVQNNNAPNTILSTGCVGYWLNNCTKCTINNCQCYDLSASATAIGFWNYSIPGGAGNIIRDCVASGLTGPSDACFRLDPTYTNGAGGNTGLPAVMIYRNQALTNLSTQFCYSNFPSNTYQVQNTFGSWNGNNNPWINVGINWGNSTPH